MVLINLFAGKEWRPRYREGTVGEGEHRTNGESNINIYTLSHLKWITGEKLLYNTHSPVWCSVMTWRSGMGEGRVAPERGDLCITMADGMLLYVKNQYNIVKI